MEEEVDANLVGAEGQFVDDGKRLYSFGAFRCRWSIGGLFFGAFDSVVSLVAEDELPVIAVAGTLFAKTDALAAGRALLVALYSSISSVDMCTGGDESNSRDA